MVIRGLVRGTSSSKPGERVQGWMNGWMEEYEIVCLKGRKGLVSVVLLVAAVAVSLRSDFSLLVFLLFA